MVALDEYKAFLEQGLSKILSDGSEWQKWLDFAANMYKYGVNNSIALYIQRPSAFMAADFVTWNKFNRKIHRGEKGSIICKNDKIGYVFDISQTYGKDVNRWSIQDMSNITAYTNQKYGIDNENFEDYISSTIAYLTHDKYNSDILFNSVCRMVSTRVGIVYAEPDFSAEFDSLEISERKKLLYETYDVSKKILKKIERENRECKEWRFQNEQQFVKGNEQSTSDGHSGRVANQNISEPNADNEENKYSEIRIGGDGFYGTQSDRIMRGNDAGRGLTSVAMGDTDGSESNEERRSGTDFKRAEQKGNERLGTNTRSSHPNGHLGTADYEGSGFNSEVVQRNTLISQPHITITCEWSESNLFEDGKTYSVSDFDAIMKRADSERCAGKQAAIKKYGTEQNWIDKGIDDEEFTEFFGYDKTRFNVNMPDGTIISERQDIGDGDGGVVDFFRQIPSYNWLVKQLEAEIDIEPIQKHNFSISDIDEVYLTKGEKIKANIETVRTLKNIEAENRLATTDEQNILAQYSGWGAMPEVFEEKHSFYQELKGLLTDDEYAQARASTLNAHYTPNVIIREIYVALKNMGIKGGKFLESSCGTGKFMGLCPDNINAQFYGVELDSITGRIAQNLYQKNNIQIKGFEDTAFQDNYFDVAVGNVPFGDFQINDVGYNQHHFLIHDYFLAKNIDKLRAGGIAALITSSGTLDKHDAKCRKYLAERAELIGAVRLPNNAFKNAGTEVTTDILFLQKRDSIRTDDYPDWVYTSEYDKGITINRYFLSHPEMMIGDMTLVSSRFGYDAVCKARNDVNFQDELNSAMLKLSAHITERENNTTTPDEITLDVDASGVRNLTYTEQNGVFYYNFNGTLNKVSDFKGVKGDRIRGMHNIRQLTRQLIDIQAAGCDDFELKSAQDKLNSAYDSYVKKYGELHLRVNRQAFSDDADLPLLLSLEKVDDDGNTTKADMFFKRTIRYNGSIDYASNAIDGLKISLSERGRVDIPYISRLTKEKEEKIIADLKGLIYKNPITSQYETADEYLSGNVLEKLELAQTFNTDGLYDENIKALKDVQPEALTAADISWKLGLSWISPEDYKKFMYETFETNSSHQDTSWNTSGVIDIRYNNYTNVWTIYNKNIENGNLKSVAEYGTERKNAYSILEDSLNLQNCIVRDRHESGDKVWYTINSEETIKAQEKQELIRAKFSEWIMNNPEIRDKYVDYYNRTYNNMRLRQYDGSHLTFPGMSPLKKLRENQVNAVARVLYSDTNTLLDHPVGAGKTYEIVASCMELKRLGIAKKSIIVVPNHLTEQWGNEFLTLYPDANILVTTKNDFTKDKRQAFFSKIAVGDWDAVIIGHSQFEKIPISNERLAREIKSEIDKIVNAISELKKDENRFSIKQLESKKKSLEVRYEKLTAQEMKDDIFCFEQLGIDYMFVDEAHMYKNCMITTKLHNIAGLSTTAANKSMDMLWKCRYLTEINDGKGVVFATGTPISNSISEMYIMQRYLDNDLLEQKGFGFFDNWVAMFGNVTTGLELAPEGTGYRMKSRLSRFDNLPELMTMFAHFADVQTADMLKLPVPEHTMHNIALEADEFTIEMMMSYVDRANDIRNGAVQPEEDNMLKITNEARRLALDPQLINPLAPASSKLTACADAVVNIYNNTTDVKGAQLVFCDLGTPKEGVNIEETTYGRFIERLVSAGIKRDEIAVIHNAKTDLQKSEMFAKVKSGIYRVLIGSTEKMGAGTNCQTRLVALHHLDCPWRSSDIEQREGRILRQGNRNKHVDIYRYVVKNTFDAYLWQIIENKQRFISQIMSGDIGVRECDDMDETTLSFAEVKACATGDVRIKEKMDLDIKVQRLSTLKAAHLKNRLNFEKVIRDYPAHKKQIQDRIEQLKEDSHTRDLNSQTDFSIKIKDTVIKKRTEAGNALFHALKKAEYGDVVGEYRGFTISKYQSNYIELSAKGKYKVEMGFDAVGVTMRIDNVINDLNKHSEAYVAQLDTLESNYIQATENIDKPFPLEAELTESILRQHELERELDLSVNDSIECDTEVL